MSNSNTFFAKSIQINGHQPTVKEHLTKVAELAKKFGAKFDCGEEAWLAGQFHDFGKYSKAFQTRLQNRKRYSSGIDHAICGAAVLAGHAKNYYPYRTIVECIYGHHCGLCDYGELRGDLEYVITNQVPIQIDGKISALSGPQDFQQAIHAFKKDFPDFHMPNIRKKNNNYASEIKEMLFARMLFSCLVDADYSISASDERPEYLSEN